MTEGIPYSLVSFELFDNVESNWTGFPKFRKIIRFKMDLYYSLFSEKKETGYKASNSKRFLHGEAYDEMVFFFVWESESKMQTFGRLST